MNTANWVRAALEHSGMKQADLARRLSERGRPIDRAAVNKMVMLKATAKTKPRLVTADEMIAISEITGYPVPASNDRDVRYESDDDKSIGSETGVRGVPKDSSPEVDVTAGMGAGGLTIVSDGVPGRDGMTFSTEHVRDYWRLPPRIVDAIGARAHDIAIIPVQGDSMHPTLGEGDFVFIDTRHRLPSPDGVYALADEFGGIVVKRLEISSKPGADDATVRIVSDNDRHQPRELLLSEVHIIGRVVKRFTNVG